MKLKQIQIAAPRIEMLPLIDIVFLLLVFFIYAMLSMAVHRGQIVDLPESSSGSLEMQEAINVTIEDVGQGVLLFLDGEMVPQEILMGALREIKQASIGGKEPEVQIFADESVSYQELFGVMDCIREAGLTKMSLQAVKGKP